MDSRQLRQGQAIQRIVGELLDSRLRAGRAFALDQIVGQIEVDCILIPRSVISNRQRATALAGFDLPSSVGGQDFAAILRQFARQLKTAQGMARQQFEAMDER